MASSEHSHIILKMGQKVTQIRQAETTEWALYFIRIIHARKEDYSGSSRLHKS